MNGTTRPAWAWEVQTAALMAAVGASALFSVGLLVSDLFVRSYVLSGGESELPMIVETVIVRSGEINVLFFVAVVTYIAGFIWWRRATRSMLRAAGDRAEAATTHWTIPAWYLALGTALAIRWQNKASDDSPEAFASMLTWDAVQICVRLTGLVFLLFGIWRIRAQVSALVAETGVAAQKPAGPDRLAPPLARAAAPVAADLGPADDVFWLRAGEMADAAGGELALLETTGAATPRWVLVPPGGDLGAVRAGLPAGAVVSAYPSPPSAAGTEGFVPAASDFYHGLLEDENGEVRYQAVSPERMPVFLSRAGRARRWALYPTDSAEALHAVVRSPAVRES